jgi:hypothetical protein
MVADGCRSPVLCEYALGGALLAALLLAAPAAAQRRYLGMGHDLRLEGIVEPVAGAEILGEIRILAGDTVRRFGVTSAISAGEEGMAIFRNQKLRPVTFKLVAKADVLQIFRAAAPGTRLRMIGLLQPDSFLIASIEVLEPTPAPTAGH